MTTIVNIGKLDISVSICCWF